jgi:hypothetical protein
MLPPCDLASTSWTSCILPVHWPSIFASHFPPLLSLTAVEHARLAGCMPARLALTLRRGVRGLLGAIAARRMGVLRAGKELFHARLISGFIGDEIESLQIDTPASASHLAHPRNERNNLPVCRDERECP